MTYKIEKYFLFTAILGIMMLITMTFTMTFYQKQMKITVAANEKHF